MTDSAQTHDIPHPFKLENLQPGKPDPRGRIVRDILWSMPDFKIFKTDVGISPIFSDESEVAAGQKDAYFAMGDGIAEFNHLIHAMRPIWPVRVLLAGQSDSPAARARNHYERELARCIAQALSGKIEEARSALARLHDRLGARVSNRGRITHLVVNTALVTLVIICSLIVVWSDSDFEFGYNIKELAVAVMMGSVGALFSTSVRLRSMEVDPTVSLWMHIVYSIQRVLVGALGALILYFGFRSGIVTGLFQPLAETAPPLAETTVEGAADATAQPFDIYWLSFVSILAGFSEQLVPNLLESKTSDMDSVNENASSEPVPAPQVNTETTPAADGTDVGDREDGQNATPQGATPIFDSSRGS